MSPDPVVPREAVKAAAVALRTADLNDRVVTATQVLVAAIATGTIVPASDREARLEKALSRIADGPSMAPHSEPWSKVEAIVALGHKDTSDD